jgi:putative copper export protein
MRRFFLFLFASGLFGAGMYMFWYDYTHAQVIFSRLVVAGIFAASLGGYLLWDDFIRPYGKKWRDAGLGPRD